MIGHAYKLAPYAFVMTGIAWSFWFAALEVRDAVRSNKKGK